MRSLHKLLIVFVLGILGLTLVGWRAWWVPRTELQERITYLRGGISGLRDGLADEFEVRDRLAQFQTRTLGSDPDVVQHLFRKMLGEIASDSGLGGVVVSDRPFLARTNPAVEARTRELSDFRGSIDAYELEASLVGEGSLESVLGCLAMIESQAWVHRVRGVSLKPLGRDRSRMELRVEVSTFFAEDLEPDEQPSITPARPEEVSRLAVLAERNLFRPPPPEPVAPQVVQAPKPAAPAPPPPPPYGEWQVVGVTTAAEGERVMVRSRKSGQTRTLSPGQSILGLRFEGAKHGGAIFVEGEARLEVLLGWGLDRRRPLSG